jgi:DNA-binding transcriptional MocR family regulator
LISEGYLQAARGSGTFVCRELPDRSLHAQVAVKLTPPRAAPPPLSRYGSGLSDDYPHEPCRAGFVCFSQWGPDLVQFPWMLWRRTLSRHLRQTRHDVFDYAQKRHFGECATVHGEAAGMHAFVRIEDKALRERAERNKVQLRSAQPCFLAGGDVHHYLFGFASLTERAIRNGIRRIAGRNA